MLERKIPVAPYYICIPFLGCSIKDLQHVRFHKVIAVTMEHIFALGSSKPRVAGCRQPAVPFVTKDLDLPLSMWMPLNALLQQLHAPVRRSIVHKNELHIIQSLGQQ